MTNAQQPPLVLITGSSGLIGGRVSRQLSDRYTIVGLDVVEPGEGAAEVDWLECDFTDDDSVHQALAGVRKRYGDKLASVIHLAAYYDFAGEPSPLYEDLTVAGTRRLMQGLQSFDQVGQFVFSSSLLVMKPCEPGQLLTETSPTQAEWEYPESKLQAEEVIRQERGAIPTVVLRIAGVYDEEGHSLPITQNIRRIAEKELESYFYPGDPDRGQAFVHLDDLVQCFDRVVESRHTLGDQELFLIAEDECLSYEILQDRIGELIHGVDDWPTIRIPKVVAKAGAWSKDKLAQSEEERPFIKPWMVDLADAHYAVDNTHARNKLGWRPVHRLSDTLPQMIASLQRNPREWYQRNKLPLPEDRQILQELAHAGSK